jgi:hypothetical protein
MNLVSVQAELVEALSFPSEGAQPTDKLGENRKLGAI